MWQLNGYLGSASQVRSSYSAARNRYMQYRSQMTDYATRQLQEALMHVNQGIQAWSGLEDHEKTPLIRDNVGIIQLKEVQKGIMQALQQRQQVQQQAPTSDQTSDRSPTYDAQRYETTQQPGTSTYSVTMKTSPVDIQIQTEGLQPNYRTRPLDQSSQTQQTQQRYQQGPVVRMPPPIYQPRPNGFSSAYQPETPKDVPARLDAESAAANGKTVQTPNGDKGGIGKLIALAAAAYFLGQG